MPISTILAHIPVWVWAILAFILVMGLIQSRDRLMSRPRLLLLPLAWAAFGLWGIDSAFGARALPLLAWAAGLAASLALLKGAGWPQGVRYQPETGHFFVPGSWLPLTLMLAIFAAKFALGMALALRPELAGLAPVAAGFSLLFGAISGAFLARSRAILAQADRPAAATQSAR
ncbi:hypothetical protein QWJ38_06200 [Pelomonas sp. PFR6]|uniref:DUF1453 domain-containing protein n=2 Tax=Roseateles violae TaxID=3058042 RepID=A0ABT8DNB2_9BURK|nr:DUF6622 family protein [Pelomonas sp. PFR6]MDN3919870.1 hypothetical protein [Pelomonas sp. PFR6]